MKPFKTRDIEASLSKKGFEYRGGSKHGLYIYCVNGKKTSIKTIISRGIKEYSSSNMGKMKNQLRLTSQQLADLIMCPLRKEMLAEIYERSGNVKV